MNENTLPGKSPEELLDAVNDRDSLMAFVWVLIADREQAEQLERERPQLFQFGGAGNWQNSSISSYLEAAAVYFEDSD